MSKVRKTVLFNQIRHNITSKSAIILGRCLCIMTDSMTGWPAAPAHAQHSTHGDAPSTPQKGKREKEGQRHGNTETPPALTRPACYGTARPEDAPPLMICTTTSPPQRSAPTRPPPAPPAAPPATRYPTETATSTREGRKGEGQKQRKGRRCKTKKPSPTPSKS